MMTYTVFEGTLNLTQLPPYNDGIVGGVAVLGSRPVQRHSVYLQPCYARLCHSIGTAVSIIVYRGVDWQTADI